MRRSDERTADVFGYLSPQAGLRGSRPLRAIRRTADQGPHKLSPTSQRALRACASRRFHANTCCAPGRCEHRVRFGASGCWSMRSATAPFVGGSSG